jgi:NAD(P)-dependent dehydrogenase (short-subunit alcohol dehydrogenase family)
VGELEQGGRLMGVLIGKRAVVTGAASGIGRAIAERFAREGGQVALVDRDAARVEELASKLQSEQLDVAAVAADVTSEESLKAAFGRLSGGWGGLDVVVANAGVQLFGQDAAVDELDLTVWQQTIDVNLTGMFLTCKHGVRALLEAGGGSVICTGSPTGLRGTGSRFHAYSASKAAAFGLVRVMAADYAARNIRVNALVPGFTDTPLVTQIMSDEQARQALLARIPMKRPGDPAEVAAVAAFLASDDASYVTGATYIVDGGETVV